MDAYDFGLLLGIAIAAFLEYRNPKEQRDWYGFWCGMALVAIAYLLLRMGVNFIRNVINLVFNAF